MKQRIASLLLALVLCMGSTVSAAADSSTWTGSGLAINPALRPYYLWDNEMTPGWDDEVAHTCLEEEGAEQLDFWRGQITIDTLRSTGYCLITSVYPNSGSVSGKGIATVCYCDAPARLTLLCDAMKLNYGGVSALSLDADGRIHEHGSLEPTYEAPCQWESSRGAGTYWDLPEGFYQLDILAGTAVYFVVGSPKNITIPDANKGPSSSAPSFSDVPPDFWCYDSVSWAVQNGVTKGYTATTFRPGQTCTHAQILTFLWRAAGSPRVSVSNPYRDPIITPAKYYYDALLWAWKLGLVSDASFAPNTLCKRSDAVTYLWKLSGSPAVSGSTFADVSAGDQSAVAWAVEAGVVKGTSATTFSPDRTCTRGHIVTFLYRYFER